MFTTLKVVFYTNVMLPSSKTYNWIWIDFGLYDYSFRKDDTESINLKIRTSHPLLEL